MDYKNVTITPSQDGTNRKNVRAAKSGPKQDSQTPVNASNMEAMPTLRIGHQTQDMSVYTKPNEGVKYHYRKTLGRGGMKVVLQVYDNDTMRDVAMALLPDISTRSKDELGQFLREARITASLEHPNIVPVHDIGLDSAGSPYFTMKLLKGETLASVLKKLAEKDPYYIKKYTFDQLMRVYIRICNAIDFAHSRNVLHLDLKPENVQIGDYGEVLVLDWGLARKVGTEASTKKVSSKTKLISRQSEQTQTQSNVNINGTPGYMSPEQIRGIAKNYSRRTDIYALGAILYAIITYKNPIEYDTVERMLQDTLCGNITRPSLRAEGREIPFGIEAVVMKAMSVNPEDRYSSVRELRNEVNNFTGGFATKAEKASWLKRSLLFVRRHSRTVVFGTLILVLSALLGILFIREANRRVSLWNPLFTANFIQSGFPVDSLCFLDKDFHEDTEIWRELDCSDGLKMLPGKWLSCNSVFPENIRANMNLQIPAEYNGKLEFLILAVESKNITEELGKPILTYHIDMDTQSISGKILQNKNFYAPGILDMGTFPRGNHTKFTFFAEFGADGLSLGVDKKILAQSQKIPYPQCFIRILIRAAKTGILLEKMQILRKAPPENMTPLVIGDTLLREKLYEKAVWSYLQVDDDKPGSKQAETALMKAYLVAGTRLKDPERLAITTRIKMRLAEKYPKYNQQMLLEADVCFAWQQKDYALAIALMKRTFEKNPSTQIVTEILQLPHSPLSADVSKELFDLIRRTKQIKSLDLSNFGLQSLPDLTGMNLISLDCSGNKLTDLDPIKGMDLISLNCSRNRIQSLKILSNIKSLRYLDCSENSIDDFSVLKNLHLERMHAAKNPGKASGIPLYGIE